MSRQQERIESAMEDATCCTSSALRQMVFAVEAVAAAGGPAVAVAGAALTGAHVLTAVPSTVNKAGGGRHRNDSGVREMKTEGVTAVARVRLSLLQMHIDNEDAAGLFLTLCGREYATVATCSGTPTPVLMRHSQQNVAPPGECGHANKLAFSSR